MNRCEINELDEIFEDAQISVDVNEGKSVYQVANIVEVRGPSTTESSASDSSCEKKDAENKPSQEVAKKEKEEETVLLNCEQETDSPVLTELQDQDDVGVSGELQGDEVVQGTASVSLRIFIY